MRASLKPELFKTMIRRHFQHGASSRMVRVTIRGRVDLKGTTEPNARAARAWGRDWRPVGWLPVLLFDLDPLKVWAGENSKRRKVKFRSSTWRRAARDSERSILGPEYFFPAAPSVGHIMKDLIMDIRTARFVLDAVTKVGIDARIREDYPGRAMYGKTTDAVVIAERLNLDDAYAAVSEAMERAIDEDVDCDIDLDPDDIEGAFRADDMGRGVILY